MADARQPAWAGRIKKQLEKAKAKDSDLEISGAHSHKYELRKPVSREKVEAFERKYGFCLPEEYRDFLLFAGDGGAGPYFGVYSLDEVERELGSERSYCPQKEPVIYPEMSEEAWEELIGSDEEGKKERAAAFDTERKAGAAANPGGEDEEEGCRPYAGILPIGSQGCTLMTGLVISGAYQGRVVYFDLDRCGAPFFVREEGFFGWYERWLKELLAGYDVDFYGMHLGGSAKGLMERYERTEDIKEKAVIVESCYKFYSLPAKLKTYYKKACRRETDAGLCTKLIKMLAHFHTEGLAGEIDRLWEYGAYGEAISVITYEGTREVKEKWLEQIFEKLPQLTGEAFQDACYTVKALKDHPAVEAGRLRESLLRTDLCRNDRIVLFYCIEELRDREAVADWFLAYLSKERDVHMLLCAVRAMAGVKDEGLMRQYVTLLDQYRTHEDAKRDYEGSQKVLKNGSRFGCSRPAGQLVNNLLAAFDHFGKPWYEGWRVLMGDESWEKWKGQQGFL